MLLTQSGGFIVKPISILLGKLLSLIYDLLANFGIVNIGVSIIIFTVVIRMLLFPMLLQQNKSSKITSFIQPEIAKVQKKYKGKKDQKSMMDQQAEVRAIQEKYGVSLSSGCLSSLIQIPIFFAVYRVVQNVPAYVAKVYDLYSPIAESIMNNEKAAAAFEAFRDGDSLLKTVKLDMANKDTIIDVLAKFQSGTWDKFIETISGQTDVISTINNNVGSINDVYSFVGGIDLSSVPGFALTTALIIPILSMVFQFLSMHATPQQPANDPQQEATMKSMKMFMNIMPIMSFFVCVNVPAGVGLYWAAGSLVSFLTSIGINFYFNHCNMDKIIEKSVKKAAKKKAKRKAKGKKSFAERMQEAMYEQNQAQSGNQSNQVNSKYASQSLRNYSSSTSANKAGNNSGSTKYKAGSLASKANAMQRYNDNGGKK